MIDFLVDLGRWFADNLFELETAQGTALPGWIPRLWEHVQISIVTMVVATALALPLGAWFGHTRRGGVAVPAIVNIGRALPSFGIVALALPITIRIADAVPFIDSGLGFFPTFVALLALALPPIFTNTYAGVSGVDPEIVEAARGMGLTERRLLREVELPLALPVILTGIRLSAVAVVATVPLGALVAFGGLGRFIIDGFAIQDDVQIVAGAVLVAALSVFTEIAFSALERLVVAEPLRITRGARRAEAAEAGVVA
jgi:osmoprotectant transport system permease protein